MLGKKADGDQMQYSRRKRFRLATGALLLLLLLSTPLAFGLWGAPPAQAHKMPGAFGLYMDGVSAIGVAGLIALPLGALFALWLILGEQRAVNRRVLTQRARNRRNGIQAAKSLSVILGGAGLIVGSLSGLYAALLAARPDLVMEPRLPLTFDLAIPCLIVGAVAYGIGRLIR